MPQKKNPDAAELLRAKAPRVVGHLAALHGVLHALPLTYNKDLQEDKEHLFDAADTIDLSLAAATGMVAGARFHRERLAAAAADELIAATDLADLLVKRGTPFREAHGVVAGLVREAVESGRSLADVAVPALGPEAADVLGRARGWSRRSARAGRRSPACASSWRRRGRGSMTECRPTRLPRPCSPTARSPGPRRGPDLVGCRPRARRGGRDHRRDGGLPPLRAGLPRLRRPDGADLHALRPSGDGLRLPLVRDPRRCSTRSARPRTSAQRSSSAPWSPSTASRPCARAVAYTGSRTSARAPAS